MQKINAQQAAWNAITDLHILLYRYLECKISEREFSRKFPLESSSTSSTAVATSFCPCSNTHPVVICNIVYINLVPSLS